MKATPTHKVCKNKLYFKSSLLIAFIYFITTPLLAQVGIGTITPDASSALDISSTTKGVLIPRLTNAQRDAISNPANGLMIFNTDTDELQFNSNSAVTPIWHALSMTPTSFAEIGDSVKYTNTDTSTDVNPDNFINAPLFGTEVWNDNSSLYSVSGHEVTIAEGGRYEIIANVSLENDTNADRNAPEIIIGVDGIPTGSYGSTGYIRSNNSHEESSLHIREVLELDGGDVISILIVKSANNSKVVLRSSGSSSFYIEKKR